MPYWITSFTVAEVVVILCCAVRIGAAFPTAWHFHPHLFWECPLYSPHLSAVQPGAPEAVDITQTDEWNEISMLQERYPDIYSRLAQGRALQTVADLTALINDITDAVDLDEVEAGQHGFGGSQPPPGDDGIPD